MAELSKNFPPPAPDEAPIAQAMMANMGATNSVPNAMPPGGDRKVLTLHSADEALIQAVAASNPRTVVAMMGGSANSMLTSDIRMVAMIDAAMPTASARASPQA